jgi:hypothetical protein
MVAGNSTTITWSSINATGCAASGSWSGTMAPAGAQTLTSSAVGTHAYSLTCANTAGSSAASSVNLTVTAKPSSGGGAFDALALLGLAALGAARILGLRPRVLR